MRICVIMALILGAISGCADFQLASTKKSVAVDQVTPNKLTVNFCGNAYMGQKEVEKYAYQRAAEEALAKGYAYFSVLEKRNDSQYCALSAGKDNSLTSMQTGQASPYEFPPYMKPNVTLTVLCFSKEEKRPADAIDAREYLDSNFPGLER